MPTYDYECAKCGHTFDAFQSMSDAPLKKCPECGKMGLKRLIGGGLGVIFKGSGFYATDSRSGSKAGSGAKTAASDSSSSGDSKSTESTKSESASPKKDSPGTKSEKVAG